jgi:ankyrin repeat protein
MKSSPTKKKASSTTNNSSLKKKKRITNESLERKKNLDMELMYAVRSSWLRDKSELIEKLIKDGADVNAVDNYGSTPLLKAIEQSKFKDMTKFIRILISHNADTNAVDKKGYEPLMLAIKQSKYRDMTEVIDLLLSNRANVNAITVDPRIEKDRRSPLYEAIEQSRFRDMTEVIQLLIRGKADVNAATYFNRTPLAIALMMNKKDIADLLIANHANILRDDIYHVLWDIERIGKDYVESILKQASDEEIAKIKMSEYFHPDAKDLINREKLWRARRNPIAIVNGLPSDNQLNNLFYDDRFKGMLEYMGPKQTRGGNNKQSIGKKQKRVTRTCRRPKRMHPNRSSRTSRK